jgi:hypothetical protein
MRLILQSEEDVVVFAMLSSLGGNSRARQQALAEFFAGEIDAVSAFVGGTVSASSLDGALGHFLNAWRDVQTN